MDGSVDVGCQWMVGAVLVAVASLSGYEATLVCLVAVLCSNDNAWLNAHYDPVASIYTFSTCIGGSTCTLKMFQPLTTPIVEYSKCLFEQMYVFFCVCVCSIGRFVWRR